MARRAAGWYYLELQTPHQPVVAMPGEVSSLLLGLEV
jgi:hypothetical protein